MEHFDLVGASKCTWKLNTTEKSPHTHYARSDPPGTPHSATRQPIMDSVLNNIGNTPMVRLNRIPKSEGVVCEMLAKCEFYNAGGSVKDRIGVRMIEDAEKSGRLVPGSGATIIEPTSGNTGIGLALACAVKGYRCIIVMPEKMSNEKVNILRALGAEIVRTPTEAASEAPDSHISVSVRLNKEIPNSHILNQYDNPANPLAHYEGTAEEILEACGGKVDMIVAGTGTGGTITGIARLMKERCPECIVVGVDPYGSILAEPASVNETTVTGYEVEGIGYDFIPKVLDRACIDKWHKADDKTGFVMARRMIKEEGLLCGGSSGLAMHAACIFAKALKPGQKCVVICPDSIRNYMTKHLSDDWMVSKGFAVAEAADLAGLWWSKLPVSSLPQRFPMTLTPTVTCSNAVDIMHREGFDQMPCVDDSGNILGMVTEGNIMAQLLRKKVSNDDSVRKTLYKTFRRFSPTAPLWEVSRALDQDPFVLICSEQTCFSSGTESKKKTTIFSIVTRIDMLNYIMSKPAQ